MEPNNTIFGGDVASSIMMMDTLIKLQQAEIAETQNQQELKTKSVEFTRNLGSAVSNLMDEMHAEAWEDIPKVDNIKFIK